ncbi:CBS domain-containing protein [Methanohalophilus halophilus]|uniref:CBS domain-containing protein n=1 Tax=Methanohalophilus halophilus TaxID=2177 RepID=A0A1L3Q1D2_9EURY|nr:CBS domain-containing protein [Methanohalophilus halophilus]APH38660.1 histidine kinase [Methanohalophilus halophilus]RNI08340.1 CBS domain-containing protein [Methanohalophilus halophilus]SDW18771.1 CBS domain-containing protein [Methanohalophilus halophilus]
MTVEGEFSGRQPFFEEEGLDLEEKCKDVLVRDIMITDPVTIKGEDHVEKIFDLFNKEHFHTYPVVDENGDLLGIIDQNTILQLLLTRRVSRLDHTHLMAVRSLSQSARGIMIPHPVTITSDMTLCEIAETMIKHKVERFCVVDEKKLVGIVCKSDVIQAIYSSRS